MMLRKWDKLPPEMQIDEIREHYDILRRKKYSLFLKRVFDILVSGIMLLVLLPVFLVLAIAIKIDSPGPVFYRQVRVTQYNKRFRIFKFRSMEQNADRGSSVTTLNDQRVTRVGRFIRKFRFDEISQLLDVFRGKMTFVGSRPEVPKYVNEYTPDMMATLLLPAGVTSLASIYYKDESKLLDREMNTDKVYIEKVLPGKMYYNLRSIEKFSFWGDIGTMFKTLFAMLGKEYRGDTVGEAEFAESVMKENAEVNV